MKNCSIKIGDFETTFEVIRAKGEVDAYNHYMFRGIKIPRNDVPRETLEIFDDFTNAVIKQYAEDSEP